MKDSIIEDVIFELKDIEIFRIPDTKTRISTVQNYFFPRLEILLRHTINLIQEIYDVNVYEKMTFVYSPSNRKTAKMNKDFSVMHIGLSGKRRADRDLKFRRSDGKFFKLHPTYLTYNLDLDGSIYVQLLPFRQNVGQEFIVAVNDLYSTNFEKLDKIFALNQITHARANDFVDLKDAFAGETEDASFNFFYSPKFYFPVEFDRGLSDLILSFAALYPLLDSLNAIGEGETPRLSEMLEKFKTWCLSEVKIEDEESLVETDDKLLNLPELKSYNFVRAGLWWAVLARDNWTCCSCGRSSKEDGIILEVDHIVPRSLGGTNKMENLQTLCKKCNIGKSNKDSTDLRRN